MVVSLPRRYLIRAQLQICNIMILCSEVFLKCGLNAKYRCSTAGLKFNFLVHLSGLSYNFLGSTPTL